MEEVWVKPDRPIGVDKPHISYRRYANGEPMVMVRYWPMHPINEGWSISSGEDLEDAWSSHMQCRCDDDEEE